VREVCHSDVQWHALRVTLHCSHLVDVAHLKQDMILAMLGMASKSRRKKCCSAALILDLTMLLRDNIFMGAQAFNGLNQACDLQSIHGLPTAEIISSGR